LYLMMVFVVVLIIKFCKAEKQITEKTKFG